MEKFSVSRLIGAPPGYVGFEDGGTLTEAVRRRPYQVILLDEFEKAHPDVSNILLQVFDEGRLTDSQGRSSDFRNTVFILTSNLGSDITNTAEVAEDTLRKLVKSRFSNEFVNRLDDVLVFNKLTQENIVRICHIQIARMIALLQEKNIMISVSDAAVEHLANKGYDGSSGARPLKRLVQNEIMNPIASYMLEVSVLGLV